MSDNIGSILGRGRLISLEGLSGVGKTYMTRRVVDETTGAGAEPPVVVEEFSHRHGDGDLGRCLLRTLSAAASDEHFLRGGYPKSETLLLLAIKMHDYEKTLPALRAGHTVIEGRSIHSTAIYQSLILNPDDDRAAVDSVQSILETAARWRPLPDLTIVLTDNLHAAVQRAETRDDRAFTEGQWAVHLRAAALFERLAELDPEHVRLLDRRHHDADSLVEIIGRWIATAPARRDTTNVNRAMRTR